MNTGVCAFVQARMSSRRFPGKVLAPFRGVPIVRHVVDTVTRTFEGHVTPVVVTSISVSDDPLVAYLQSEGIAVSRGPLDDVVARFNLALGSHPCAWVMRLCADSPLQSPTVLRQSVNRALTGGCDVVSTIWPDRTYPSGQNVELVRTALFTSLADEPLSDHDREHVTAWFYRHPERYRIATVSRTPSAADQSVAVDTVEDLARLETLTSAELADLMGSVPAC